MFIGQCERSAPKPLCISAHTLRARARAREIDAMSHRPPLGGVPIAIKDALSTRDIPTTAASRILEGFRVWYSPPGEEADQHLAQFFEAATKASFEQGGAIEVGSRPLAFRQRAKGVVWVDFDELCVQPRSQNDYLEIASG